MVYPVKVAAVALTRETNNQPSFQFYLKKAARSFDKDPVLVACINRPDISERIYGAGVVSWGEIITQNINDRNIMACISASDL